MQIVVKVAGGHVGEDEVRGAAAAAGAPKSAVVSKVFPEATEGRRSLLYVLDVPDETPPADLHRVLRQLKGHPAVEYAELPSERRPR